jgi:5-deoxy-glucuronate isomerase
MGTRLFWPAGSLREDPDPVLVTPETAGWTYCGLRTIELGPAGSRVIETGPMEIAVVPLAGSFTVECEGRRFELAGRDDVFQRVSDFAYLPIDSEARISSAAGGRAALPSALASRRLEPAYGPAEDVPVEVRGAGAASRQINNFMEPNAFEADKLVAVEVLTPEGNWSSYPPHKHDECRKGEAVLEEIYYFEIDGTDGFGFHRLYTTDGEIDATETVGDGDVFLIPRGYHGPSVAAPGHHMYYLNVLAGPAPERTMAFCDDPAHHWIRGTWHGMPPDPRLPMTTTAGRR